MPLHQGMLDIWDKADSAFVSAYRKHHALGFDIEVEYLGAPNVAGRQLVLVDPMVATGGSLAMVLRQLKGLGVHGPRLRVITALASSPGLKSLAEEFQDLTLYTGCIDAELDARNYIVPGLGDAGDRLYGTESEDFLA